MTPTVGHLVNLMAVGMNHSAIYFRNHPRVGESATEFSRDLGLLLDAESKPAMFLGVVEGRLVYEGKPLVGPTLIARRLVDASKRLRCGGFLFQRALTSSEALEFFALCGEQRTGAANIEEARRLMNARGIVNVVLSPPYGQPGWLGQAGTLAVRVDEAVVEAADGFRDAIPLYQSLLHAVEGGHAGASSEREIDVNASRHTAENLLVSFHEDPAQLLHLSRYPDYDSYTIGHSVRVALLAVLVGRHLGLDDPLLVELGTAGLLHDVGKGKIPHEILFKKGPLDDEERKVMSTHPILGAQSLLQSRDSSPLSIAAAFGHHVRHDRRGYPTPGPWAHSSRITGLIQVCDVFEALTAVRPYKPSLTPRRAYEIMLQDPGAFDPGAFAAFLQAVGLYPPGSRVRLTSGEEAIVARAGTHIARPLVTVTHDAGGRPYPRNEWFELDLADTTGELRSIDDILLDDINAVEADPEAYAKRPITIVLNDCGHPIGGHGASHACAS